MSQSVGTVEAPQQDLASINAAEAVQDSIDFERFEAVPEHDGNLQRLIDRYGDNPGRCPYIKSMGDAGLQLVQRLAEAEKNPDRGPTIRELMEARKKEAEIQTEAVEAVTPDNRSSVADKDRVIKLVEDSLPYLATAEAESFRLQTVDLDARRNDVVEEPVGHVLTASEAIDTTISIPQEVEQSSNVEVTAPKERQTDPLADIALEEPQIVIAEHTANTKSVVAAADTEVRVEAATEEVHGESEIVTETSPQYLAETSSNIVEVAAAAAEVISDYAAADEQEQDVDIPKALPVDELVINLAPNINNLAAEPTETPAETIEEPMGLFGELKVYIEALEADKVEAVENTLRSLAEVLEVGQQREDNGAEISATDLKEDEYLFVELLDALDLDYQDETVKKLMKELFTPEIIDEITENNSLSIDQLNYLGTSEYRSTLASSLFTHISQLIKQKIEPYLQLARYALANSRSY